MITIEPARLADIPELVELLLVLFAQEAEFSPAPEKHAAGLSAILSRPEVGLILVARSESCLLGMVSLLFTVSTAEGGPVCVLEDMVVLPEYRGQSVGSKLLVAAIQTAQSRGFLRVTLLTDRANERALRFYESHGFHKSAMVPLRLLLSEHVLAESKDSERAAAGSYAR
jgi:GNAT superfamily N-acetyltransferase